MELTNQEQNIATIVGGEVVLDDVMSTAIAEGWSQRKLATHLHDAYGVAISQFGARSMLAKWKEA